MTLFVNNEISGGRANLLGQKLNCTVEITLHAYDGSIVYQKEEANNMALTVTANSLFFAVYMKSGEIKIYDTNIGSLIVPYYQKSNLAFLSSYSNGNLAFIDLEGKITVINIIKKMAVFENKDSVKSLLLSLNNKSTLNPDDVENNKEETPEFYLKSFYLNDCSIYIDVSNSLSNCSQTYCLNNQLGTWEKVESISASVVTDTKAGNVAQINRKSDDDMDVSIDQPGFGVSLETVEKDLFKLEKDKQDLIDEIGLAVSKMEKRNHSKISKIETIDQMEERIMLYERLEHKEEYFIALETYIMKLVLDSDVERLRKLIGIHKKIKIDNSAFEEYFCGIKKSKILEDFIKPKIKLNPELYKLVFKGK